MDFLGVPLFIASIAIMAFAGFTKGLVGFAMPMIIFSSLTVLSNSEVALSLLIIPTLIANIVQAFQDGINAAVKTVLKFKTFILILAVSMIITTQVFYLVPTNLISFLLGSVIVIYVLLELFKISVLNKVRVEGLYKSILALISGFCGGISGVWGPTTVIYLLNNNGSLYSLKLNNAQLNWILSFKEIIGGESSNLFYAFPLIINSEDLLVSTNKSISLYNRQTATMKWKIDIALKIQPIFSKDFIFLFSDENFITCVNSNNGKILWSRDFFALLRERFDNSKSDKIGEIIDLKIADNKIFLFTDNSNVIQMDPFTSKIISVNNISSKITSNPLFLNESFYFLDKKNRFIEIN